MYYDKLKMAVEDVYKSLYTFCTVLYLNQLFNICKSQYSVCTKHSIYTNFRISDVLFLTLNFDKIVRKLVGAFVDTYLDLKEPILWTTHYVDW